MFQANGSDISQLRVIRNAVFLVIIGSKINYLLNLHLGGPAAPGEMYLDKNSLHSHPFQVFHPWVMDTIAGFAPFEQTAELAVQGQRIRHCSKVLPYGWIEGQLLRCGGSAR